MKILAIAFLTGASLIVAQPVLAQSPVPAQSYEPQFRRYSEVEAEQSAYERGRADEAARRYDRDDDYAYSSDTDDARAVQSVGYCYQRKASSRTAGTIIGAIAGGLIGNSVSNRWDRGGNTIGGAMVGGMLGRSVGDDSVQCYQDAYYSYDGGYYEPRPAPRGYVTVFFSSRPSYGHYRVRHGHRHHRW